MIHYANHYTFWGVVRVFFRYQKLRMTEWRCQRKIARLERLLRQKAKLGEDTGDVPEMWAVFECDQEIQVARERYHQGMADKLTREALKTECEAARPERSTT